ncbi:uncharacterized protein EDB91DRAFT_1258100 [Suillus paluster]|uniref:uncharacterized protein n=1 Tax=Suillus paluster TaxID=48578 RepID=UPI001B85DA08|nr:uncharacterized protein EDB91DRAFT_1258100 [Suillus paluster]KAG1718895.1 hypothetical protein EDB91DRAFT_1258100 [Suillus paluster]
MDLSYLYVLSVCRGANVPVPLLPYWDDSHVSVPPSPFARSFFGASALLSIEIRAFSVVGASPSLYGRPPPFMAVPLAVTSSAFASVPPPYATVPVPLWPSPSLYGRPRPFMAVPLSFMAVPVPLWPSPLAVTSSTFMSVPPCHARWAAFLPFLPRFHRMTRPHLRLITVQQHIESLASGIKGIQHRTDVAYFACLNLVIQLQCLLTPHFLYLPGNNYIGVLLHTLRA